MKKKALSVVLLFIVIFLPIVNLAVEDDDIDYIWLQETVTAAKEINEPKVYSKAAVVFDRDSKTILYGKNENEKLAMASTTKIMTAIILVENKNLSEEVEVTKEAAAIGGSSLELKTGDKLTYESLLYGLMLCSGNDAAAQIAISVAGSIEEFADLIGACEHIKSLESCPTLRNPKDCSPLGSSFRGILQARRLEWVAVPFSRASSQPRDRTQGLLCLLHRQTGSLLLAPPGNSI